MVEIEQQLKLIVELVFAGILGSLIGIERSHLHKIAGMRTYAVVAIGSCMFGIISATVFHSATLAGAVVTGIGFICAGLIIHHGSKIEGITTAAGLWATASIGIAVSAKLYLLALAATIFIVGILGFFRMLNIEAHLDELFFNKDSKS